MSMSARSDLPPSQLRTLNEDGDSIPGSQDSELASRTHQLSISGSALATSAVRSDTPAVPSVPPGSPSASGALVPGSQDAQAVAVAPRLTFEDAVPGRLVDEQQGQGLVNGGRCQCPWCSFSTVHVNGLMVHASRAHAGQQLSEGDAEFFRALGRGTCRACGFIRPVRGARCSRCPSGTPAALVRAVRAGDVIMPHAQAWNAGAIRSFPEWKRPRANVGCSFGWSKS